MKLNNIGGFRSIDEYISDKSKRYGKEDKTFGTLFEYMFSESDNVMAELSDGYRIRKITYGQFKQKILSDATALAEALGEIPKQSLVGLYMGNSPEWIALFWAVLMCGYKPLLMNTRMSDAVLEGLLSQYSVEAVISDGKSFSVKTLASKTLTETESAPYSSEIWGEEVFFMSSGTTENVKLCAYTAENFYYQILNSTDIIKSCPQIRRHYEGELKHLVLLPLYHVFGFIAVYLWFGFFSRTFVFPKDLTAATVLNTVRKHKVTHIFAVPMVWDAVYKAAVKKIKAKGDKTYGKFQKALSLSNKLGGFGDSLARSLLKEVRENLFGDSICFLISGGSHIGSEVLAFFNGIGYHMANGYGMTEIAITSVEVSSNKKLLNSTSIGHPFSYNEYAINEKGELMVRGKAMASRIIENGVSRITDHDEWFATKDLVRKEGNAYYVEGRADDLIVGEDGENLNPVLAESKLIVPGCQSVCLFATKQGPVLIASLTACYSSDKLKAVSEALHSAIGEAKLERVIKKVVLTFDPLLEGNDFKISRRKVASRYAAGAYRVLDLDDPSEQMSRVLTALEEELRALFAEALEKDVDEITATSNFFMDLGGTSLDYFTLLGLVKGRYGVEIPDSETNQPKTVEDFAKLVTGD